MRSGWITAGFIFCFIAFYAVGPGVCVWLALSELMPTRIRSNGMSIAMLINQAVSTFIAATFLPTVGKYGYATMFFAFAGCTVVYFITAAFFLPETKGRSLEELRKRLTARGTDAPAVIEQRMASAVKSGRLTAADMANEVFAAVSEDRFYVIPHRKINNAIQLRMDDIMQLRNPTQLG